MALNLRKLSKFRKDIDREIRKKQEFQNEGYHFEFLFYFKRLLGQPLVLRLKASFSGLSLKGSSNGFPHAPHLLANPKRINYQFFLFFSPVNGSYSSNRVS